MMLVYTNGKERAIALAAMIGGITLGNQVVQRDAIEQNREEIEKTMLQTGGLVTFFRGETCFVIYSSETPGELYKMADYNPDYANISNRPVPFIPESLNYRVIDKEFNQHLEIYRKYVEQMKASNFGSNTVNIIINAASDDMDGERASTLFFYSVLNGTKGNNILRVRPQVLLPRHVMASFNVVEDNKSRTNIIQAALVRKEMDWLISANASNLLFQRTKKMLAIGRVECALLSLLYYREKEHLKENGCYEVFTKFEAVFEKSDENPEEERITLPPAVIEGIVLRSEQEAKSFIASMPREFFVTKSTASHAKGHRANNPYSIFTLQVDAGRELGITAQETAQTVKELFVKGLVSWPTDNESLPWRVKNDLTGSIVMLSNLDEYRGKIRPSDLDMFTLWDHESSEVAKSGHTGIFVTDLSPLSVELTERQKSVYHLIANRMVSVFTRKTAESNFIFRAASGEIKAFGIEKIQYNSVYPSNSDIEKSALFDRLASRLKDGYQLRLVEAKATIKNDAAPMTEPDLIDFAKDLMDNTFCNDMQYFSGPIENLLQWNLIERREDKCLYVTKRGHDEMRYISGTSLSDLNSIFDWDRRLQMVALGRRKNTPIQNDIGAYIEDLVDELNEKCDAMSEMDGIEYTECKCPKCGAQVDKTEDGSWRCLGANCTFKIPKSLFGHQMSWKDVWNLLTRGYTDRYPDFVSKKGTTYPARIIKGPSSFTTSFIHPLPCPLCGKQLQEWDGYLKCTDKNCGFSLNTSICDVHLTDENITDILSGRKTELIHNFHNKRTGKNFAAKLFLNGKDVKFDFPPRNN